MEDVESPAPPERSTWSRIVNFPLVAMLVALALFVLALALGLLIGRMLPPMEPTASLAVAAAINITLVLAVYKFGIARLGYRPRDDLRGSDALKGLGLGVAMGALLFAAVVAIAAAADVYNIVGEGDSRDLLKDLLGMTITAAFMEEMLFRGILFRWIEEFAGSWLALAVTSLLFGIAHIMNPNATWFSSFAIAVEAGVLLGGAYMLTRSLWVPIGLHGAWNFTQGFIFDVPVSGIDGEGLVDAQLSGPALLSGGSFGLEASVIAVIIATGAGAWLVVLAVRRGQLVQPWWVRRRTGPDEALPA